MVGPYSYTGTTTVHLRSSPRARHCCACLLICCPPPAYLLLLPLPCLRICSHLCASAFAQQPSPQARAPSRPAPPRSARPRLCACLPCAPGAPLLSRARALTRHCAGRRGRRCSAGWRDGDARAVFEPWASCCDCGCAERLLSPEAADLLCRMLEFDPTKRIDATAALRHPYFGGLQSGGGTGEVAAANSDMW